MQRTKILPPADARLLQRSDPQRSPASSPTEWTDIANQEFWLRRTVGGPTKRVFDLAASICAIVFLLPLFLLVAVLVKLHDGGPVIFRHARVGRGGQSFGCMKFRTMAVNADVLLKRHLAENPAAAREWERSRKLINDPRITPIGAFLRSTSLDELPQLFNIVAGDMSVVGPRPVVSDEIRHFGLSRIHYLSARPGLTGLWQVEGRSTASYATRVKLDSVYVLRWSMLRDIAICLKTVPAVLLRRGAY